MKWRMHPLVQVGTSQKQLLLLLLFFLFFIPYWSVLLSNDATETGGGGYFLKIHHPIFGDISEKGEFSRQTPHHPPSCCKKYPSTFLFLPQTSLKYPHPTPFLPKVLLYLTLSRHTIEYSVYFCFKTTLLFRSLEFRKSKCLLKVQGYLRVSIRDNVRTPLIFIEKSSIR